MGNRQATKMTDMNNLVMSTDKKGQKRHCGSACLRVEEGSQWPVTSVYNVSDSGSRRGQGTRGGEGGGREGRDLFDLSKL